MKKIGFPLKRIDGKTIGVLVLIALILLSVILGSAYDPSRGMERLEEKELQALTLMSAATSASVTISLIPDDIGSTLADEIDDVTGYIIAATACVMLERYLLALAGPLSYYAILPVSLLLFLLNSFLRSKKMKAIALRLLVLGICLLALIPLSLSIGEGFGKVVRVEETFDALQSGQEEVEEVQEDEGLWDSITGFVSDAVDTVSNVPEIIEDLIIEIIDAIAIVIVTVLVIPVFTIFLLWMVSRWAISGIADCLPDDLDIGNSAETFEAMLRKPGEMIHRARAAARKRRPPVSQ